MSEQGALILCIEDEESLRRDLAEELTEAGYSVIEAADGEDALAQLDVMRPDLVLCDILMPGIDGFAVLRHIQARPEDYGNVPFLFLSALADRREIADGKLLGADDYLTKPIDFDLLLATVHARLRQVRRIDNYVTARAQKAVSPFVLLENGDNAVNGPDFGAVLDIISTAIVLIGPHRDICFMNKAACAMVRTGSELASALANIAESRKRAGSFAAWVDRLLTRNGESEVSSFRFADHENGDALQIVGCALNREGEEGPHLALFLAQAGKAAMLSSEALCAMFGFTPTESQIAAELAAGKKPAEIAGYLKIAQTTVAFHMRNIFQKTGVSRQASLVALLLTSPASIL